MSVTDDYSVQKTKRSAIISLTGGAAAGLAVDVILFPFDTLKTRLQSQYGFLQSGGFRGIYKGIGPMAIGSPFTAGIFFGVYEGMNNLLLPHSSTYWYPIIHMFNASVSETASCIVRVPSEIIKQRRQALYRNLSAFTILQKLIKQDGIRGLYRGFSNTVLRDVPFSIVQFPVWEWTKKRWRHAVKRELTAPEVAACGSISGGIAAAITTPLDVVKTQVMLTDTGSKRVARIGIVRSLLEIYKKRKITGLFAGFIPRVTMLMFGGAIYFGIYEKTAQLIERSL